MGEGVGGQGGRGSCALVSCSLSCLHAQFVTNGISSSNEIDLKILREMGVSVPPREKYEKKLKPINKFRAGVYTVIAAMRLSDMQEEWSEWKGVGEKLKTASKKSSEKESAVVDGKERRSSTRGEYVVAGNEARKVRSREL